MGSTQGCSKQTTLLLISTKLQCKNRVEWSAATLQEQRGIDLARTERNRLLLNSLVAPKGPAD